MARLRSFSSRFKASVVIELLSSGKHIDIIAAENGASKMPIKFLVMLAQYYGVSTDYLVGLTESK